MLKRFLLTLAAVSFALIITPSAQTVATFYERVFNGANFVAVLSPSITNNILSTTLTARNVAGAVWTEKASRFTVVSAPSANSQATASIAAEASVRHVADCVIWSADASAAVTAAAGTLILRDGATGAGTVIAEWYIAHRVAAGAGIQTIDPDGICGLNLAGTTNTAMTAEFNAGVTGEQQAVTLTGYNIQ